MTKANNVTPLQNKLYNEALSIQQQKAKDAKSITFMPRSLVLATLPHSDPGAVPAWGRKNGAYSLVLQPGYRIDDKGEAISIGLPYGTKPRLLLCWLTTEAVKTKSRTIKLADSLSEFMAKLDLHDTGGKNGSRTHFRNQMIRLFSAQISCVYSTEGEFARQSLAITDETHLWWDPKSPDQIALWESTIVLGEKFFEEIIERPIPIDFRALKALKNSCMSIDLYIWLTYRLSRLGAPAVIPWNELKTQFGSEYARERKFREKLVDSLKKVLVVYRDAKVTPQDNGLLLYPSRTSVSINASF